MLISMLVLGVLMVFLSVLYVKTVQDIECDDLREGLTPFTQSLGCHLPRLRGVKLPPCPLPQHLPLPCPACL